MSGTFPRVIVTLSPLLVSRAEDEIVINPRSMIISRGGRTSNFTPRVGQQATGQFAVAMALVAPRGKAVSREAFADLLWGDREDGGPDTGWLTVLQLINNARPRLFNLGIVTCNIYGFGYRAEPLSLASRRAA